MPKLEIQLSRRAERDLRRIGPGPERDRIVQGLRRVGTADANLDVRALRGHDPWLRLRIGDWRVLYRPVDAAIWIERIVNRRDLLQATETL